MLFQAITGAQTPACLFAASNSVETVTPPLVGSPAIGRKTLPLIPVYAQLHAFACVKPSRRDYSPAARLPVLLGTDAIV